MDSIDYVVEFCKKRAEDLSIDANTLREDVFSLCSCIEVLKERNEDLTSQIHALQSSKY